MIGTGLISLILFIGVIVVLNVFFKRNIALSMAIAWLLCGFLGGSDCLSLLQASLLEGVTNTVILPSMFFCFMSSIMKRTGIIHRLVNILNSAFGRIPGGAGYVSTLASAVMGAISGSGSGNAAVSGSITIPWMLGSGFSAKTASTIVCGNATLGMSIPPSTSMFMLLAMPVIAGTCETGDLYLACLCGGLWILCYRLLTVFYYTRKYQIKAVDKAQLPSGKQALKEGWSSLLIFLGVLLPLILTSGPLSKLLAAASFGETGVDSINMLVWIPALITLVAVLEGRAFLPKFSDFKGWGTMLQDDIMKYPTIGGTIIFSLAGSEIMTQLGLAAEMEVAFQYMDHLPKLVTVMVVGAIILLVAGPLNSTGTLATLGSVGFIALTGVGVAPATALVFMLLCAATEGCVPPSSAPLYVTCGISGLKDPSVCFKDLTFIYALGSFVIAVLVGMSILPIP